MENSDPLPSLCVASQTFSSRVNKQQKNPIKTQGGFIEQEGGRQLHDGEKMGEEAEAEHVIQTLMTCNP